MYEENTYRLRINWKSLILKIVLFILIALLILWIVPTPKLDTFYNKIFNDNINSMKTTAKEYYTNNELPINIGESKTITLKEMVDKNLIMEFVDKNNNKCDNTNSFSQVTKTSLNEYVIKTQLTCGNETNYVLETINLKNNVETIENNTSSEDIEGNTESKTETSNSSNSLNNEDDDDEDKILENAEYDKDGNVVGIKEYEYKKAIYSTKSYYVCPEGYVLEGTKCFKTETGETIDAEAIYFDDRVEITDAKENTTGSYKVYTDAIKEIDSTETYCPEGYTKNNDTCYKYIEATVNPGSTTYTCPTGYKLEGKTCISTIEATKNTTTKDEYTCKNGDKLEGTKCSYNATHHDGTTTCSCPSGYSSNGSQCIRTSYQNATYHNGTTSCSCPSGYSSNGSSCVKTSYQSATPVYGWSNPSVSTSSTPLSEYNNGSSKRVLVNKSCSLSSCTYTYYTYSSVVTGYTCSQGTLSGSQCVITDTKSQNCSTSNGYYTCSQGTLSGSQCVITDTKSQNCSTSNGTYTCDKGGNLNGASCTYEATKNTESKTTYSCPDDYTLDGEKCIKKIDAEKNTTETTYSCPDDYTLDGTTCYKTTKLETKDIYKLVCPEGYIDEGSEDKKRCYRIVEGTNEKYCEDKDAVLTGNQCIKTIKGVIKGYTCPEGYILDGEKCIKKTTTCEAATLKQDTTVTYKYQWSTKTSIEGWTKTGKTRTVKTSDYIK